MGALAITPAAAAASTLVGHGAPASPGSAPAGGASRPGLGAGAASRVNPASMIGSGQRPWPAVSPSHLRARTIAPLSSAASGGNAYTPLAPTRLLDSRISGGTLGPGGSLNLTVTGGLVPQDASAVALNVTVTDTTASSYLAVYPAGGSQPLVSNLNWNSGQTVPNLVIVPVGSNGQVTFYNDAGDADLVLDLEGYFAPPAAGITAGSYVPVSPARIIDTRTAGQTLGPGATLDVQVVGVGPVPHTGVGAVLVNVTVTDTTAPGYLTAFPTGTLNRPTASNLNWAPGETVANRVLIPVGAGGQVSLFNCCGDTDLIIDVNGYFTSGSSTPRGASLFVAIPPVRVFDTRQRTGEALGPGGTLTQQLTGIDGIAAHATAVVTDVTAAATTAPSYFTVYPGGAPPLASDLNWGAGGIVPNLTVVTVSATGQMSIYNSAGSAAAIVDAFGYFTPLEITTTALPSAPLGVAYSATLLAVGGTAPYSWALSSPALPAGLSLSAAGVISGTPTATGPATFTLGVTDASAPTPNVASAQMTITIFPPTGAPVTPVNWSGYAVTTGPYSAVSGTFSVPSLYLGNPNTNMAEWVGIDGFGNQSLIQAGIDEFPDPANSSYFYIVPWWEILPAVETPISAITALPGDSITITLAAVGGGVWNIEVADATNGQEFTIEQAYSGPGASAEWIVEAPTVNGQQSNLAPYTPTEFTQLSVSGGQSALTAIVMDQPSGQVSTPSSLDSTGFAVQYGSTAPPAP